MKITVSDLKQNRQWRAMLGLSEKQFYILLKPFKEAYFNTYKEELAKRKVDVNINYCIKNEEELLLFTLLSLKVGLTYDALGIFCEMNASNAKRNQKIGLDILKITLKQLDHMPIRNILNKKSLMSYFKGNPI